MFKNTGKLLVMVFSLLTMVVGCKDDKQEDPAVLESSVTQLEFSSDESSREVEIRSNCSWKVEVSEDWCTVTPESGNGNGKIEVSVKKNPDTAERTAKIVLTSKGVEDVVITVKQNELLVETVLTGMFSVSAAKQVRFSKGNLQYQASTKTWRFAENQYDVLGADNEKVSSSYGEWIDLFGWGTSGYNEKYPYMTSEEASDYGDGENGIAGTDYDWGVYNAISYGGNKAGMWRTLTKDEWKYLSEGRTDAKSLRGHATVNGVKGYVLLPDGWSETSGLSFTAETGDYTTNSYSIAEWNKMEAAGAVFLPAAGSRKGTTVSNVGAAGYYWSTTNFGSSIAYSFSFNSSHVYASYGDSRYYSFSVRLVQE